MTYFSADTRLFPRGLGQPLARLLALLLLLALLPGQARAQDPIISSFAPASGSTGTSVVLTGTGFNNTREVRFNGTLAPGYSSNGAGTQLTVSVPAGATTGAIVVSGIVTSSTSATSFVTDNYIIGSGPLTVCSGKFYDSGGPNGVISYGYGSFLDEQTTFSPATAGAKVQLVFSQFEMDQFYDYLEIYDGPDTNARLVGKYSGISSPVAVTATNPTGQLTVRLYSLSYTATYGTTYDGFAASISCVSGVPTINSFTPVFGAPGTSVVLTGLNFTGTTAVRFNGTNAPGFVVNSNTQLTVSVPAGATSGYIAVAGGTGIGMSPTIFTTDNTLIGSPPITACSGNIYDAADNYAANANRRQIRTTTIMPATAGGKTRLTFTQFSLSTASNIYNGQDNLKIYDGPDTNAPLLGSYAGSGSPGTVTATNPTGQLTLKLDRYLPATAFPPITPAFSASISCLLGVPNISSFAPTSGVAGTSVVLTGLNFTGITAVAFNGVAAPGFVVNSATQITVPVPAGNTNGLIKVTNGNGTGRSTSGFTVAPPSISGFTPATGAAGMSVVLTGTNLIGTTSVSFNGVGAAGFVVNSNTQLTATVPVGAATGPLSLATPGGTATSTASFTALTPGISGFTPGSGVVGTSVVVTGTDFTGTTSVRFNGTNAPGFVVNSNTQLTVSVPAGATNGPLSLTTPNGTATSAASFTLVPPSITSFTPTSGASGTSVVITGTYFLSTTSVRFNGTNAPGFVINSDTQITVSVPVGATTGPISITNANGTGTSASPFTLPPPTIASFSPTSGVVGTSVVLTGTSFFQVSAVRFNGVAATGFVVNSSTQITVNVPSGATTGPLSVTTPSGTGTSAASFTILVPVVSSFSPTSGVQGTSVVITGANFTSVQFVRFNGTSAPGFVVNSSTQITASVPTGATTGLITVTTASGTGTSAASFTVPPPTIASFTPTSGGSGTSVVITGTNFSGTTAVRFNGMNAPGFVVNSNTQITVPVPAGVLTGPISVTTGTTATSATSFVTNNYWLAPAAITTCSGTLYDPAGPGDYGPNLDQSTTLTPATAGAKVRLTFTEFLMEYLNSALYIYDGPDASAPLLGRYTTASPGTVTATNATGQLTVRLLSMNMSPTGWPGFAATISCVTGVPTISSFTPAAGLSVPITITGSNFTGTTAVRINGLLAPGFVVNSATQITVNVPDGATAGRITVTNAVGTGTSSSFTPLAPAISSFTPTTGVTGASVVVTGTNFYQVSAVRFNGVAATYVVNSSTQITTTVPGGASYGPISVTNSLGTGTSSTNFGTEINYIGAAANITTCLGSIYDSGGPYGDYGNNENLTTTISPGTPGAKVRLTFSLLQSRGGSDGLTVYNGPSTGSPQIGYFAYTQNGATPVITATNATGQLTLRFTSGSTNYYFAGFAAAISCVTPTISSFTPTSGAAGTSVVITGTEFTNASAVTFNGVPAPGFVVNSDTQITVPVPAGNANGLISVTAPFGTATSTASFTVLAPTLTAVSPFIGVPGSVVTLTGTNLTGTSSITFFGSAGQRTVSSGFSVNAAGTQLTGVLVPAGAQSGPITATTGGGSTPVGLALFSRASVVAAGGGHSVAVRPDGSLWAWGDNASGQLGLGIIGGQQNSPVRVGTANTWVSATAGSGHTVAVQTDGTLWAWGLNANGQLGLASTTTQNTPQRVGTGTNWASATAGSGHTVAVQLDGTLWAWGNNASGQLGLGTTTTQTSPQRVGLATNWVSATAGSGHTVAVQTDGTLWAWGLNASSQLGLGNTTSQTSPQRVGLATSWASATAGSGHTVAVQADGTLWAWGLNSNGQLGLGNTSTQTSPQQVGTGTTWMSATAGDAHTLAVQSNGLLWVWGSNANGQLGLGNTTSQTTPQILAGLVSWISASAGTSHSAGEQSCAAVWTWGLNGTGQVGDGSTTQRPAPVQIFNPISLLSFTPATAGAGSSVTVTGTNLASITALTVNGASALASVTNSTATGFTFLVPSGAPLGAGMVTVAAGCGSGSSTAFTVGAPSPLLYTLSRAAELPGQAVVLTGLNFTSTSTVSFGGVPAASVTYTSPTSLTAVVPVAATPGSSAVVVSNANGSSPNSPAFEVLQVYRGTAASGCLSTASLSLTGTGGAGSWHYLRLAGVGGAVVAAIEDTRNLGTVTVSVSALGTATGTPVRDDGNGRAYLDRNFYLTATNKTFAGQAVRVRFFGLSSELARLTALDANATLAGLKASQYSGYNENCTLLDNDPGGERRLLAAPATALAGADWFTAQVSVTDHFSEFYLTGAATPLLAPSQAPLLTGVSPARNLPTASQSANVALTFSQPIDATTAGSVRVFGSLRSGQLVRGGNVMASGNTITVDPARSFAPGERIFVTVPATVQATNGYSAVPKVHEFTAETAQAPATFLDPAAVYTMQAQSQNVAVGDLNGDGLLDVVTSDFYGGGNETGSAVVRFGLGNGQLGPLVEYNDTYPTAITLADVDGDGDLDLMTSATTTSMGNPLNQVYTRLNNGSGSFGAIQATQVLNNPTHMVLGDVDGDGDLDMLTAASRAALSFNNNNNGTFTTASPSAVLTSNVIAVDVALGDVDGDGDLDALVANGSQVSVRLNSGSGVFSGTYNVTMGGAMTKLVVGDVDGDGDLDLATSSSTTRTVSVRLNNGDGTFGGGADHLLAFAPKTLALGDVDGDGDLDLVTAGNDPNMINAAVGQAVVRLNNGSGAFSGGSGLGTGGSQPFVALGDMDGDGTLDLLTSHAGNSRGYVNGSIAWNYAELFVRLNTALPPTLAGFSPPSGPAGTLVTITGTNLSTVRGVRFGGSSELALITAHSPTSLTVPVPVGAATGALTLTTSKGVVLSTATAFTYTPRPAGLLATLSPAGSLEACAPLALTATATSPAFTTGAGLGANVGGMVVRPDGKLLLGGFFSSYDGVTANRIVQLNPDGSLDATFSTGTGFDNTAQSVALQADGKVVVVGDFTTYNGTAVNRIIRLNADGSYDATFAIGTGFDASVQSVVVQPDGHILVGGSFTTYNGTASRNRLIRLNPNGSRDASFDTGTGTSGGFNGTVQSIVVQPDGQVLVGGSFTSYNTTTGLNRLIRLSAYGSYDATFATGTGFNSTVNSLALQPDGKVLVGGAFTTYNSPTDPAVRNRIIRLNTNGTPDAGFTTGTGFTISPGAALVNAVTLQPDGKVLVGGQFTSYNGTTQNRLARLNNDGTLDASFALGTGFDLGVRRLAVQPDGSVVVGGNFANFNGAPAVRLIRLLPDGSANTTPTAVSGASFAFAPGNTTANPLITSTTGTYSVVASLNGETSAPSNDVIITPCISPPTLVALSTVAELPGLPITITGTGFTAGTTVSFDGVAASGVTVNSLTSLTAVVPAGAAAGTSPVVVSTTVGGSSLTAPAFQVLAVYDGGALDACTAAVPATPSINDGAWHYLLSGNGQVVAAYRYTGPALGELAVDVLRADPAASVRQQAGTGAYLDRNFHLTAAGGRFDGRTVALRLYGLSAELDRLRAANPAVTLATLTATQYSGANEDCVLANNSTAGELRTLPAPATWLAGAPWFAAEMSVADHFSEFYLAGPTSPLPVKLVSFTAQKRGTIVQLSWQTASERNSARFEVERSLDGRRFERIGTVAAKGNTSSPTDYAYGDAHYPGETNTLYYRLKQVDRDGSFSYSPVRVVQIGKALTELALYPNPAKDAVMVSGAPAGAPVQVSDALGRVIAQATADAGGTILLALPEGLAAGMYVVRSGTSLAKLVVE